jgi:Glycosyltransferase like family
VAALSADPSIRQMIAFAVAITEPEPYIRFAGPGIERASEPDSAVLKFAAVGSIGRSYNLLLDAAAGLADLEALVLVHPFVEITDERFCATLRAALADPEVAAVGPLGANDVTSIAWWEGSVVSAPIVHSYHEHGSGQRPAFSWTNPSPAPAEVETLDGLVLALSPWAVQNVRFDESLHLGYGFDLDYCLQLREAGRKLVAADLRVTRHLPLELVKDRDVWVEAHVAVARKWSERMPGIRAEGESWERQSRRAEAVREASRAFAYSSALRADARVLELERQLDEMTSTIGWRMTEPLRRLNQLRRERLEARAADHARSGSL